MPLLIRDAIPQDYEQWRPLWDAYCNFYNARVSDDVTRNTWSRIVESSTKTSSGYPVQCVIATIDERAVGFGAYVLHASTWEILPICYIEDLFVDESTRGRGVGRAIIDHLIALAKERGWSRVYWHTQRNNATARKLYDRYGPADDFVRYVVRF